MGKSLEDFKFLLQNWKTVLVVSSQEWEKVK